MYTTDHFIAKSPHMYTTNHSIAKSPQMYTTDHSIAKLVVCAVHHNIQYVTNTIYIILLDSVPRSLEMKLEATRWKLEIGLHSGIKNFKLGNNKECHIIVSVCPMHYFIMHRVIILCIKCVSLFWYKGCSTVLE